MCQPKYARGMRNTRQTCQHVYLLQHETETSKMHIHSQAPQLAYTYWEVHADITHQQN